MTLIKPNGERPDALVIAVGSANFIGLSSMLSQAQIYFTNQENIQEWGSPSGLLRFKAQCP